jgi:amidase
MPDPSRAGEYAWANLRQVVDAIADGRVSSTALVESQLARIEQFNRETNCIVQLDADGALAASAIADQEPSAGNRRGPLHGVPITIKDSIEVAGMPTVCGSPDLKDHRPLQNAAAVQRLVDAGAIILGKTNVPIFASDFQTYNSVYGVTHNPWDTRRTPGGSSGGAAAALATGLTFAELGSDLAGSLRVPAAWTGICALKPTHGLVPMRGSLSGMPGRLREPDTWVTGPMARSVEDLDVMLRALAGPRGADTRAWRLALPELDKPVEKLRLAVWLDDEASPVDDDVKAVVSDAIARLSEAGIALEQIELPDPAPLDWFETYLDTLYSEMGAEFDDAKYSAMRSRADSGQLSGRFANPRLPPAATMSHRQWIQTCERRERLRNVFEERLAPYDALICPAMPNVAIFHDHRRAEERSVRLGGQDHAYVRQIFWMSFASLTGCPALSLPAGLTELGLPAGLQLIGTRYSDLRLLGIGQVLESVTGGFSPPPGPWCEG